MLGKNQHAYVAHHVVNLLFWNDKGKLDYLFQKVPFPIVLDDLVHLADGLFDFSGVSSDYKRASWSVEEKLDRLEGLDDFLARASVQIVDKHNQMTNLRVTKDFGELMVKSFDCVGNLFILFFKRPEEAFDVRGQSESCFRDDLRQLEHIRAGFKLLQGVANVLPKTLVFFQF